MWAGAAVAGIQQDDDQDRAADGGNCGRPSGALNSDFWQARYDEGTTGWDRGGPSPALQAWLHAGELTPCRVLVPGCGRGHEVIALAAAGFEVTGIDYAPAAVDAVRQALATRGLSATIEQADLFDYQPAACFEAIYEQTCLCALQPERWGCYERRLAAWLAPGGRLFAAFMQTDSDTGPPFACPPEAMRVLFAADRWVWPARFTPVAHPLGLTELTAVLVRQ